MSHTQHMSAALADVVPRPRGRKARFGGVICLLTLTMVAVLGNTGWVVLYVDLTGNLRWPYSHLISGLLAVGFSCKAVRLGEPARVALHMAAMAGISVVMGQGVFFYYFFRGLDMELSPDAWFVVLGYSVMLISGSVACMWTLASSIPPQVRARVNRL